MVPERLRTAREKAGLSQEQLAHLVDIDTVNSRSRISNYESGRNTPPFDFVLKVARVLDYPEGYFYTVDNDFAELMLRIHRNKSNSTNPYYNTLIEARELVAGLEECLKKALD
ncbi:helix-turn-helix transcriptional regulator [Salmonella enterica subsp. enterica serovar Wilhelmsburg]|nr:helix-turn-helix transcriptional regulator [Salmonella enterica subsp. enterica serovar Wilhelmsburg]EDW4632793.1 helix-turn-helix transcriptional regulator [Salmonella enterica subsp. enterica]